MTTLRVTAVLFDMDGTLVDSTHMVEETWREFSRMNHADPAAVIDFAHGRPSRDTIARFSADPLRIGEWIDWITKAEGERFTEVTAIPGALEVVRALPSDRWAVVTSALREPARERLLQNGFPDPAVLIGADDVTHGKPDPEGFLAAASALGVEASACVVFEDSVAGLRAAIAAGCTAVAVGAAPTEGDLDGTAGRIADFTDVAVRVGAQLVLTFP